MELQMQFIQTKARILTPDSWRKFATSWEYTRPEPHALYHPQSDGLVERFNCTLKILLIIQMKQISEGMWMKNCRCWCWPISPVYKKAPGSLHTGWCPDVKCSYQMFGGAPCPWETHYEYAAHLQKWLEEAIMWFGTTYMIKQCNSRSSVMIARLLVGDTK